METGRQTERREPDSETDGDPGEGKTETERGDMVGLAGPRARVIGLIFSGTQIPLLISGGSGSDRGEG